MYKKNIFFLHAATCREAIVETRHRAIVETVDKLETWH